MEAVQYYYAVYGHCQQAAAYYAEKYDQPAAAKAAVYEPEE